MKPRSCKRAVEKYILFLSFFLFSFMKKPLRLVELLKERENVNTIMNIS